MNKPNTDVALETQLRTWYGGFEPGNLIAAESAAARALADERARGRVSLLRGWNLRRWRVPALAGLAAAALAVAIVAPTLLGPKQGPAVSGKPTESPSVTATASTRPSPSANPTASPTGTPLPIVSLGQARYPAGPALVPTLANQTMGTATLKTDNLQLADGSLRRGPAATQLEIVCSWTSPTSVRPAFQQRVKMLGENLEAFWTVGPGRNGILGAYLQLTHGMLTTPTYGGEYPGQLVLPMSLADPTVRVDATSSSGNVTGSIGGRVQLQGQITTIGDVTADLSLTWNCGSAPAGVTGTARPVPTGDAYDALYQQVGVDWHASSGGATVTLQVGCPQGVRDPLGDGGDSDCTAAALDHPATSAKPLTVAAGSTIEITASGRWIPWPEALTYWRGTSGKIAHINPIAFDGNHMVFKAPAGGTYSVEIYLEQVDDRGWTFRGAYLFNLTVK